MNSYIRDRIPNPLTPNLDTAFCTPYDSGPHSL